MYKITKHIICELTACRTGTVEVATGDRLTRAVACRLTENGVPWVVPEGATVRICCTLPDGTDGIYSDLPDGSPAWMVAGNIVTIVLHEQLMSQAGRYEISIVLIGTNGEQLATWPIRVQVVGPLKQTVPGNLPPIGAGFENRILFGGPGGVLIPLEVGDGLTIEDGALIGTGCGSVDLTGYATEAWVKAGYQPKGDYLTKAPVSSVNGKTGAVQLGAADVGALPSTYTPPNQTAEQVGADPKGAAAAAVSGHNADAAAHNDLRLMVQQLQAAVNAFMDVDDTTRDSLSEVLALIDENADVIDTIITGKVNVADIIDNLVTNVANKPLSAAQGVALKNLISQVSASLSGYQPKGDYALTSAIPTKVSQLTNDKDYLARSELEGAVEDALTEAKESGEFDGPQGPAYTLTEADKATITAAVVAALPKYAGEVEAV